ncbi:hypothetical protein PN451_18670 [Dolichospermum planctonicum CS-1226]|uniref:Transposase n=1 Tax=Dolichospermum planctonicum CS-1226 TaxID=3021751 RepID=A0ABT5AM98_9CYAN|nr:hypothetical protein [Dolichospermum planctonicum]MDB9537832.1 hypothetical protein [Dolichospermum planctonicum CS-1226]
MPAQGVPHSKLLAVKAIGLVKSQSQVRIEEILATDFYKVRTYAKRTEFGVIHELPLGKNKVFSHILRKS